MKRIELSVSDLPTDLLKAIFQRLPLVDLVRASAVSRTWYDVSRLCLQYNMGKPKTPWLMWLEEPKPHEIACYAKNFEENGKLYTIKGCSKELRVDDIVGCSKGWLVILEFGKVNPYLLNPFTQTQIKLPAIEELDPSFIKRVTDHLTGVDGKLVVYRGNKMCMRINPFYAALQLEPQAIVTADKGNKVNGVFVKLLWRILYWRRRDNLCSIMKREIRSPEPCCMMLEDNMLYVLNSSWNVEIWEFCACDGTFERLREIINAGPYPDFPIRDMMKYMVRLETGEVLIAARFIKLFAWELYKMKMDTGKWEDVQELDGHAVFLGLGEHMALLAEQVNGCKGNAIYYQLDDEMVVLELHTMTIENLSKLCYSDAGVWIVPNFCE